MKFRKIKILFGMISVVVIGLVLPTAANAQWITVGNTEGCVTYTAVTKKIGNKVYTSSKTDCRYSNNRQNIKGVDMTHLLFLKPVGNGSWREAAGGISFDKSLFVTISRSATCQSSSQPFEFKAASFASVDMKDGSNRYNGRFDNWRTRRTLACRTF